MHDTSWGPSDFRRVALVGGVTVVVMAATLLARPFHPAVATNAGSETIPPAGHQRPATESVSFVASPTIDTGSDFFVGCGDGSNGYFGEQPKPATIRN
jgi:hypothetical protein